ncbi:GLIPR1-like protein 1 [Asterias amurensis]|uniref:GLIPR1-like protein 1 n=1 Tax=Asterias amurensis TaxID=7602 RepID=UPI003AB400E6
MARLLITVLFAVVFVAVLRIQAEDTNSLPKKFLRTKRAALTSAQRDAFLDTHNSYRGDTSPPAADMHKMVWNDDLAKMAQAWSEKCVFAHGQPDGITSPFPHVGQNLYVASGTVVAPPDGQVVSKYWHDEVAFFDFDDNECSGVCGHYTQEVWSDTTDLGCGWAFCPTVENAFDNGWVVTCNYGPGGNYEGEKPYKAGEACSACPGQCVDNECV